MLEGKADVGPGHRQPLHGVEAGGIFGARRAQEFAPRRNLVEQPSTRTRVPGGSAAGPSPTFAPWSISIRQPSLPRGRLSRVSRDTLAIEGSASPRKPKLVTSSIASSGKLGGGVALQRQAHLRRLHSVAVVGHLDQLEPARRKPNRDRSRAGIERIFDKLLQGACGPFHDLARGDAIDELRKAAFLLTC